MKVLKVKKGGLIAKRQEKVMEWYLIQEGSVECRFSFVKIVMKRNSIAKMRRIYPIYLQKMKISVRYFCGLR